MIRILKSRNPGLRVAFLNNRALVQEVSKSCSPNRLDRLMP